MASKPRPARRRGRAAPSRAALFLLAVLLAGCAGLLGAPAALDVSLVSIVPQEIALFEQKMAVDVRVRNPGNRPLVLTGMKFDLELNGRRVLRAMSPRRVEVPRLGEARVRVTGTTTTLALLRQLLSLRGDRPVSYRLKGVAYTGAFGSAIPFEDAGAIRLPALDEAPTPPGGR